MRLANSISSRTFGVVVAALLIALPVLYAQRQQASPRSEPRSEPARAPARAPVARPPATVYRANHGSVRHVDTHVVTRPEPAPVRRDFDMHHDVFVHHDVDVDIHRNYHWHNFTFGARFGVLPVGCVPVFVGGTPYYYDDGLYYQQSGDSYEEVYPPAGVDVPQPPDGAVEIDAGNQAYYYAGGAFYVEQGDGYVVAPPPIGVTVPELPPGAIQVSIDGNIAYQFNGIYYRPVFADGVTQYVTFAP